MALTDLTRISTAGIATGTSLSGAILHGDAHFRGNQVGINSALFDSSERRLDFKDNVKLRFGDSGDLSIFHDGSDSRISNGGGLTYILGDVIRFRNHGDSGTVLNAALSGVDLYASTDIKLSTNASGVNVTGILTATTFSGQAYNTAGIATFYNLRVSNDLTVEGTTTTLDTNLVGVDRIEVGANSNSIVGVAITQSGTADIFNLYDGSTEVFSVADGGAITATGNLRIGANSTTASTAGDDLVIEGSSDRGLSIISGTSSSANIYFGDSSDADVGRFAYQHNDNAFDFHTNGGGSARLRINSGGQVLIGTTTNPAYTNRRLTIADSTNSGTCAVEIRGSSSGDSRLYFTSSTTSGQTGAYAGKVLYNHANNTMGFYVNGTIQALHIASTGLVGINNNSPATVLDIKSTKASDGLTVTKGSNVAAFLGHNGTGDEGLLHLKDGGTATIQIYGETGQVSYFNAGNVGVNNSSPAEKLDVTGSVQASGGFKTAGHPVVTYASFTHISGGSYATRLGSTGTSTLRHTQIYGGGSHIATFDGYNTRLGIGTAVPDNKLHLTTTEDTDYSTSTSNTQNITNALLKLENLSGSDGSGVNNYVGIQFAVASGATSTAQLNYVRTGDNAGAFKFKARNASSTYPNLMTITSGGQTRMNPPDANGGSSLLDQQALIGAKHIYTAYHNFSSTNSSLDVSSKIKTNSCGEIWVIGGWANGNGLRMKKYTFVASGDTAITEQSNTFASRYGVGITLNTPTMTISGDYVNFNFTFSDNQGSKMEKLKIHFEYFHQFRVDA